MKQTILTSTFTRFRDRLRIFAAGIIGSNDDAEDVIHDAFCRLWSNHPEVTDETYALKLSYTAVRNTAIDSLRQAKSHTNVELKSDIIEAENDSQASSDEIYAAVLSLSKKALKPGQYEIFRLHDIEGMSYRDVAEIVGMSQENVRMTLSRARKTIREIYRKHYDEQ